MHEGYRDSSDNDDSDSDCSSILSSSDWDDMAQDLWVDVQCLLDLDAIITCPAPDIAELSTDKQKLPESWDPHVSFRDRIKFRFPNADPSLVERLARANWGRFLKGKADRERNQMIAEEQAAEEPSIEQAGTVAHHTAPISKFHDSGLGTSINTGSAYAETVMTYHREGGASVRIPPLPEEAKQGNPFECIACGGKVVITNSRAWKYVATLTLRPRTIEP